MKKYKPYLGRVDLVKNQVAREELKEQEAKRKRSARVQQQNKQRWLKYQEQLRSELAARYFHGVVSAGGDDDTFRNTYSTDYDGIDAYISTDATYSELDTQNNFTFSFWIKPTNLSTSKVVFSIGNGDSDTRAQQFYVYVSTDGRIYLYLRTMSYYAISNPSVISANVWHHVLICRDENEAIGSKAKIFVNNFDETVNDSTRYWGNTVNATTPLYIGEHTNGFLTPFVGNIDELAIWPGTDLRNDVATIYNSGVPNNLNDNGLTAPTSWYRFEEGSGTTIADSGSSTNNATIQNSVTFETDVPS